MAQICPELAFFCHTIFFSLHALRANGSRGQLDVMVVVDVVDVYIYHPFSLPLLHVSISWGCLIYITHHI